MQALIHSHWQHGFQRCFRMRDWCSTMAACRPRTGMAFARGGTTWPVTDLAGGAAIWFDTIWPMVDSYQRPELLTGEEPVNGRSYVSLFGAPPPANPARDTSGLNC